MDSWLGLLEQGHLLDADLGLQQAQLCFLWSHMMVVDEIKDFAQHESLSFVDFLEALARVAELKSLPSFSDLQDAGYADSTVPALCTKHDCLQKWLSSMLAHVFAQSITLVYRTTGILYISCLL